MSEWRWLPREAFLAAHALQMQRYGGLIGVRDEGMLESAMRRPQHLAHYSDPDVYALAAS